MTPVQSSAVTRNAVVFLAVIAGGACLYWLRDILTPLALAMFLAVMVDGFARVLEHRLSGVSRRGATPLALLLSLLIFGGSAYFITKNAAAFGSQLTAYTPRLDALLARGAHLVGVIPPPTIEGLLRQLKLSTYLAQAARWVQDFASTAGFVLVYLGFILASRRGFERKIVGLFPQREERQGAMAAFLRIRDGVEQYLWVQTVTGLMIAAAAWIAMVAVGLDNATFWTFVIFIASYIPVVGGIIGVAAPPVFALVEFPTLWQAIVLFAVLQTVTLAVGNVIYPRMQSRSVNLDPVVVLLALAFWSAIWGLTGAFLSTPLTVMTMVILAQFPGTRWVSVILSADGDPQQIKNKQPDEPPDQPSDAKISSGSRGRPSRAKS